MSNFISASTFLSVVCSISANAQTIYQYSSAADGSRHVTAIEGDPVVPQSGFHAYDNWRGSNNGGSSNFLRGRYALQGSEIADELVLETQGQTLLSDIGFSVWNGSQTGQLTSYRATIRFYDGDRQLVGSDSYVWDIGIPARSGIALYSDGGFYIPFGIHFSSNIVFMSTQFSEAVGAEIADIGVTLLGPRTTGYSSQFAHNFTTGQTIDFDGSDQTNMRYFIDTTAVPVPGVTAVLVGTFPLSLRRRR